jgi:general secretion pathway protein E
MPFAVLRTLEGWKSKTLEELNYSEEFITSVRMLTRNNKQWIIIVSWPTWSGKSTLLYAVISEYSVQVPDRLIYSIENPVEKDLNLWNFAQMEVDPARWMEFKTALKSLMRMAPDVIFVWEIRDKETALAALEASNTWHLVFATLHVNNSIEIESRLADLIQDDTKISELKTSLKGAIAQRLLPILCDKCMQAEEDTYLFPELLQKTRWVDYYNELKDIPKLYVTGSGCSACKGMGTIWRIPVVEIISYNKVIQDKRDLYMYLKYTLSFKSMFWYAVDLMREWKHVDYRDVVALYDAVTDIKNIDPEYL